VAALMVRHRAGEAAEPAEPLAPVGLRPDPRAVRVTVVGADLDDVPAIVVEPGRDDDAPNAGPRVDGSPVGASLEMVGPDRAILLDDGDGSRLRLLLPPPEPAGAKGRPGVERREVVVDGWRIELEVESAARAALQDRARRGRDRAGRSGPTEVHAIIPGVVVSVSIAPGDIVTAGQQLLVVEAMKMQNELRAPRDGTVERIAVGAGATIDVGDLLVVLA
jgi:biotin carboxyl carrier protein